MKKVLIVLALVLGITTIARAECHYVWVDNVAHWVCDYTK